MCPMIVVYYPGWHKKGYRLYENINLHTVLDVVQQILYPQKYFYTSI